MRKGEYLMNKVKIYKLLFIIPFLFFVVAGIQMFNLSLSTKIDGINLSKFASNRNTKKEILYANRGTIYTANGDIIAQNVDAYTVIAYLSPKRSEGSSKPKHVVDKQMTAEALSPLLNMSIEDLLKLLNKENLYQVELRPGGRGITELKKEEIMKLQLPGIDFIRSFKRYYPNNDFLSYTVGYVRMSDDSKITGEMGIEKYYNDYLSGSDGYLEYQKDLNGYKIPNTPEKRQAERDGMDIYLTIDDNIQMFTDRVVKEAYEQYSPEWFLAIVMEAKTGKILGTSSAPSFNPNTKKIENYLNPLVSYTYEPGSTMKTFTYMCAMEKGTYNGEDTFKSGKIEIGDDTISDWNEGKGWGTLTFNHGFTLSSNVGVANMVDRFINRDDLKTYYEKLGFGKKTDFTLPNEANGKINFKYKIEVANAAFGQGITVTPIQFVQAFTAVANDGVILKPYIVDKIIDPNTTGIVYEGKKEELGKIATTETIIQIRDLMYNVINGDPAFATGTSYKIDGYNIIGKTGTAQYVDPSTGEYYTGTNDYIRSFAGMFPKDDPEVIIYMVAKKPYNKGESLSKATVRLVNDIAKYLNINAGTINNEISDQNYIVPNFNNKDISIMATTDYSSIIIGDGTKIINQYPKPDAIINDNDKMFVVTNGKDIKLPNMTMWSGREVDTYCKLVNLKCNVTGYGYVSSQSVVPETNINTITELNIELKRTSSKVEVGS